MHDFHAIRVKEVEREKLEREFNRLLGNIIFPLPLDGRLEGIEFAGLLVVGERLAFKDCILRFHLRANPFNYLGVHLRHFFEAPRIDFNNVPFLVHLHPKAVILRVDRARAELLDDFFRGWKALGKRGPHGMEKLHAELLDFLRAPFVKLFRDKPQVRAEVVRALEVGFRAPVPNLRDGERLHHGRVARAQAQRANHEPDYVARFNRLGIVEELDQAADFFLLSPMARDARNPVEAFENF
ncbi:Uncharacterised protein [uncultured archaeon]|nr:Uncharacterised protein [uncultured archaeon]